MHHRAVLQLDRNRLIVQFHQKPINKYSQEGQLDDVTSKSATTKEYQWKLQAVLLPKLRLCESEVRK